MTPTQVVIESIRKSFPQQAEEILSDLKYDSIMKCWYFVRNGIFTGIESCGYIHQ